MTRTPCIRCGFLTQFGLRCLFCQVELAGLHVAATFGPPLDGYGRIAHQASAKWGPGKTRVKGAYHMTFADRVALGEMKGGIRNRHTPDEYDG